MPKNENLKKLLMIGSGPIVIGQAAEFDYAGTQACKAIREEGIECVLINSNPATIMTDSGIADRVYIEPLTAQTLESVIERERPQGLLAGFGGQTGLNLGIELDENGVPLGEWYFDITSFDEDGTPLGEWIFDEYPPPLAMLPRTDGALPVTGFLCLGLLLIGCGATIGRKNKYGAKHTI